jgi:hypothetical protein
MPHFRDVKRTLKNERLEYPIKMQHAYPSVNIGWGAHTMVGNDAKALGMTNALIVTTGLKGTGIVETIEGVLKAAGVAGSLRQGDRQPEDFEVMEGYRSSPAASSTPDQPRRRQLLRLLQGDQTGLQP